MTMDDAKRKKLLASLPERLNCPACEGGPVRPAVVCIGCTRLLGQCSAVLPYIPAGMLGLEEEDDEALDKGPGTPSARVAKGATAAAAGFEAAAMPIVGVGSFGGGVYLARGARQSLTLTPEEEALLRPPIARGAGYPTPQASAEAARLNGPINRCRKECREAAEAGDRERLDRALALLREGLARRDALREATEPTGLVEEGPAEDPGEALQERAPEKEEPPASPAPAPEPPRPGLLLELHDTNQGHRIADHLEAFARSLRSDLGQFEASVSIRRLARNGNGRVAG